MSAPTVGDIEARLRYDNFFSLIFDPRVQVSIGSFELKYSIGHLEERSKLIQPPNVEVDPLPFAFKAEPVYDAAAIRSRLIIQGGDQFETAGDRVVYHNQAGVSAAGRMLERDVPRLRQSGEDQYGTPIFVADIDGDCLNAPGGTEATCQLVDRYVTIEGAGLGIDAINGETARDTSIYFGVEIQGIENVELRLADGRVTPTIDSGADDFTVFQTPVNFGLTIWGGGGNDVFAVHGIGGPTTIAGGDGSDVVTVRSIADGLDNDGDALIDEPDELNALMGVLGRLTVDGNSTLAEDVLSVLDNDATIGATILTLFLTQPAVVISTGSPITVPQVGTTPSFVYYKADFVPILIDTVPGTPGSPLQARTVVLDKLKQQVRAYGNQMRVKFPARRIPGDCRDRQ